MRMLTYSTNTNPIKEQWITMQSRVLVSQDGRERTSQRAFPERFDVTVLTREMPRLPFILVSVGTKTQVHKHGPD